MENLRAHHLNSFDEEEDSSTVQGMFTPVSKKRASARTAFGESTRLSGEQFEIKKRKFGRSFSFDDSTVSSSDLRQEKRPKHQRNTNTSSERIINTVEELAKNDSLIGDGTKVCTLPTLTGGKHQDLKYISHQTLTDLMKNKYSDTIGDYTIVDCRYPYEYNGGHIKDSLNLHTQEMVDELFTATKRSEKTVLIFHCEFSSERAPKLLRYLRNKDRELNAENYPNLYYPEIYLLRGGYKEFYENQKDNCLPQSYMPMLNKEHSSDLRHFRSKSKSWNGFERRRCIRF